MRRSSSYSLEEVLEHDRALGLDRLIEDDGVDPDDAKVALPEFQGGVGAHAGFTTLVQDSRRSGDNLDHRSGA